MRARIPLRQIHVSSMWAKDSLGVLLFVCVREGERDRDRGSEG